jgi:hypothetical protein
MQHYPVVKALDLSDMSGIRAEEFTGKGIVKFIFWDAAAAETANCAQPARDHHANGERTRFMAS